MQIGSTGPSVSQPGTWLLGQVEMDSSVVDSKALRGLGRAASKLELEDAPDPAEIKRIADRTARTGQMETAEWKQVEDLAKAARARHKEIHKELRASRGEDEALQAEHEQIHLFLHQFEGSQRHRMEQATRAGVQAAASASFGPLGAVSAYIAHAGLSKAATEELMVHMEDLARGDSPLVFEGNRVAPVHQEKLWQAKLNMLDDALAEARAGRPVEINVQYYELSSEEVMGRLADLARAGCPVRVNTDPTRPQQGGASGSAGVDDAPRKIRSLIQLASLEGADVAVSLYPVHEQLGSSTNLMHRKLVRAGENVLLGGMNANEGSGENVDAGYLIQGPAARALVEDFARDLDDSAGATMQAIYGPAQVRRLVEEPLELTAQGLATLLDVISGPTPAGTPVPAVESAADLERMAGEAGLELGKLVDLPKRDLETRLEDSILKGSALPLSRAGRRAFRGILERAVEAASSPSNLEKLSQVDLPEGEAVGETRVGVADHPAEREALLLHAISQAEEFIFIPTFVITRAVAAALAARRDEVAADGGELDIRVLADPGIYPYGGTPNEHGVFELEDQGIPVRWALLPRSTRDHDRKIHAKQVITDKNEFFGSTNLSKKGMRDNWEVSGLIFFDEGNAEAEAAREDSSSRFLKLWDHESVEVNTRDTAARRLASTRSKDMSSRVQESRARVLKEVLRGVQLFEQQSADWLTELEARHPAVAAFAAHLESEGMANGFARLRAAEEFLGTEEFYRQLHDLPAYKTLQAIPERSWEQRRV